MVKILSSVYVIDYNEPKFEICLVFNLKNNYCLKNKTWYKCLESKRKFKFYRKITKMAICLKKKSFLCLA